MNFKKILPVALIGLVAVNSPNLEAKSKPALKENVRDLAMLVQREGKLEKEKEGENEVYFLQFDSYLEYNNIIQLSSKGKYTFRVYVDPEKKDPVSLECWIKFPEDSIGFYHFKDHHLDGINALQGDIASYVSSKIMYGCNDIPLLGKKESCKDQKSIDRDYEAHIRRALETYGNSKKVKRFLSK